MRVYTHIFFKLLLIILILLSSTPISGTELFPDPCFAYMHAHAIRPSLKSQAIGDLERALEELKKLKTISPRANSLVRSIGQNSAMVTARLKEHWDQLGFTCRILTKSNEMSLGASKLLYQSSYIILEGVKPGTIGAKTRLGRYLSAMKGDKWNFDLVYDPMEHARDSRFGGLARTKRYGSTGRLMISLDDALQISPKMPHRTLRHEFNHLRTLISIILRRFNPWVGHAKGTLPGEIPGYQNYYAFDEIEGLKLNVKIQMRLLEKPDQFNPVNAKRLQRHIDSGLGLTDRSLEVNKTMSEALKNGKVGFSLEPTDTPEPLVVAKRHVGPKRGGYDVEIPIVKSSGIGDPKNKIYLEEFLREQRAILEGTKRYFQEAQAKKNTLLP